MLTNVNKECIMYVKNFGKGRNYEAKCYNLSLQHRKGKA